MSCLGSINFLKRARHEKEQKQKSVKSDYGNLDSTISQKDIEVHKENRVA